MSKQTSVDYLIKHLEETYHLTSETLHEFQKAKAMNEEEIVDSYSHGWHDGQDVIIKQVKHVNKGGDEAGRNHYKQYYNQTYGGKQ